MLGRTVVIDRLLAEALSNYVLRVESLQRRLGSPTEMADLRVLQNNMNEAGQRVAHLVVCALISADGVGADKGSTGSP